FALYRPASTAVGMYQMTDPAFAEARRYCIRRHVVADDGGEGCWFTGLYSRLLPSHAIELAAVYLDRHVADILAERPAARPSAEQRQDLAAVVHLCGAGPARDFARRGFRLAPGERCGDHDVAAYVRQAGVLRREFRLLAAAGQAPAAPPKGLIPAS
ncbi:MAG TPA: hypothetical protein VMU42_18890, partial [Candidatus Sulfotelmatobacter sp.]|nr:hypothetical protein [Candidatus Sulfotelmatobacter sp.]